MCAVLGTTIQKKKKKKLLKRIQTRAPKSEESGGEVTQGAAEVNWLVQLGK